MIFEFSVPDGDWDYDEVTKNYVFKPLVFTEKRKAAKRTLKEFINDGVEFTMTVKVKEA